jgi:hypothetical protein
MVTEEQRERIKGYVKILNAIDELSEIEDFEVDVVIDECLAYCNRDDIPLCMERVVARIAANYLENGLNAQKVTSYKELDMSVTYSASDNAFDEKNLLQRWRKILGVEESKENDTTNILE